MLILSPTRELAQQIAAVMEESGKASNLKTLCAYGGVPKPPQVLFLLPATDAAATACITLLASNSLACKCCKSHGSMLKGFCQVHKLFCVGLSEVFTWSDLGTRT